MLAIVPNMLVSQWSSEAMRCLQSNAWNIMIYPNDRNLVQGFWEKFEEQSKSQDHTTLVIMPISVAYSLCRGYVDADTTIASAGRGYCSYFCGQRCS